MKTMNNDLCISLFGYMICITQVNNILGTVGAVVGIIAGVLSIFDFFENRKERRKNKVK
jgi:hypothetical protein